MRLQPIKQAYRHLGRQHYLVIHNCRAGRPNVFDVLILTEWDPVRIGCELPLKACKDLIQTYEILTPANAWVGERRAAVEQVRRVSRHLSRKAEVRSKLSRRATDILRQMTLGWEIMWLDNHSMRGQYPALVLGRTVKRLTRQMIEQLLDHQVIEDTGRGMAYRVTPKGRQLAHPSRSQCRDDE